MEWRPVTFHELAARVASGQWRWRRLGRRLQLVERDGAAWDFKLCGKPSIRPVNEKNAP